jgi:catechol 2,3-dioxygenase
MTTVAAPSALAFAALESPVRIGAVTLAVRDLARAAEFYRAIVGLDVADEAPGRIALGSAGETLLHLVAAPDAAPDEAGEPGLFHTAFLVPSRPALARWLHRAAAKGLRLQGASDHQVSEALYFADPEGNGIEVYADRPRSRWQRIGSEYRMTTARLDLNGLLADAEPEDAPPALRVGHIHLRATDLAATRDFYEGRLGMAVTHTRPGALWFGHGGYHHHVAANTWSSARAGLNRSADQLGLVGYELVVDPTAPNLPDLPATDRLADPGGIAIRVVQR